uniref:Uncharacterized protein n=1 Tax=Cacopsylla melanoneura TaxID=428564 RepID=A0A8D9AKF1_9HEMI
MTTSDIEKFFKSSDFSKIVEKAVADTLERRLSEMQSRIKQIEEKNQELEKENQRMKSKFNDLEQYGRRMNLRVYGINEAGKKPLDERHLEGAVVKILNEKMGMDITNKDLQACHYTDKKKVGVIIRFVSRKNRDQIFFSKRKLRGTKISITEDLTRENYKLLKHAQQEFDKKNIWTINGAIRIKIKDVIYKVKNVDDLNEMITLK